MKAIVPVIILAAAVAASAAQAQRARPVTIYQDRELDACPSTGRVSGLDRHGHNYVRVRAAPHGGARELARIGPGQIVWICDVSAGNGWYGIVYRRGRGAHCLGPPRRTRAYAGPCRSGWVPTRSVTVIAG